MFVLVALLCMTLVTVVFISDSLRNRAYVSPTNLISVNYRFGCGPYITKIEFANTSNVLVDDFKDDSGNLVIFFKAHNKNRTMLLQHVPEVHKLRAILKWTRYSSEYVVIV